MKATVSSSIALPFCKRARTAGWARVGRLQSRASPAEAIRLLCSTAAQGSGGSDRLCRFASLQFELDGIARQLQICARGIRMESDDHTLVVFHDARRSAIDQGCSGGDAAVISGEILRVAQIVDFARRTDLLRSDLQHSETIH